MNDDTQYHSNLTMLRIVLVLSMIGSGMSLLSYLLTGLMLPTMQTAYSAGELPMPEEFQAAMEAMFAIPRPYYFYSALLYALSLTGVVMMWKLRRIGFHLYALSQLLILIVSLLFLGRGHLGLGDIMLTILFIVTYFVLLKRLGVFDAAGIKPEPSDNSDEEDGEDDED